MTLDIIVPHYKEPWSEGKKLFDMLALQRDVNFSDFRVILVNDGEDLDVYPEIVKQKYPYQVAEVIIPHSGVSAARNRGMKHSNAEWIMFCDFDDTFTSIYSLRVFFDAMENEKYDMLWTPFYVELNAQQKRQIRRKFNWIFIHGKVFRRNFLRRHDISFEETLYYSEDTAFCRVIEMEIDPDRIGEIRSEITPYVWAYRRGSITTDHQNVFSNAVGLFRRQKYVAGQHLIRGQTELADAVSMRAMCDGYVTLNRADLDCDRSAFKQEVLAFYRDKLDTMTVSVGIMETAYKASLKEAGLSASDLPQDMPFNRWMGQIAKEVRTARNGPN